MAQFPYVAATLSVIAGLAVAEGPSSQQWAAKCIYHIMTDRFARTDGSTDASCDLYKYCGGSWAGIINKLDYIQGMGFGAIQRKRMMQGDILRYLVILCSCAYSLLVWVGLFKHSGE